MSEPRRHIPVAAFEPKDFGEGFIWGVVGISLTALLACALCVTWLYPQSAIDHTIALPLPRYPAPRLQADPVADLQQLRTRQLGQLDRAPIPIGTAMQQIAQDGIQGWPSP